MTVSFKPDPRADQFKGTQCEGSVEVFWQPVGLVGWFWRPIGTQAGHGPFPASRLALLAAILEGHVHYNGVRQPDPTQPVGS